MSKITIDREVLQKTASFIEAQDAEISTLREKVASYQRVDQCRNLVSLMVDKGIVSEDAADVEIKKLASSNENLEDIKKVVTMMAKQASPWVQSDNPSSGMDAVARRDAYLMSGEVQD
jgi:hypothetical protein